MMQNKNVLYSIQPQYVCDILNGKKTLELRKHKPKISLPCKVYIYCTKDNKNYLNRKDCRFCYIEKRDVLGVTDKVRELFDNVNGFYERLNGQVVAEFTLNTIDEYECELWDEKTFESIGEVYYSDDGYNEREVDIIATNNENCDLLEKGCVTWADLRKYLGTGFSTVYALHIDNLIIYDSPKRLSDFKKENKCHYANYEQGCCFENCTFFDLKDCDGKYSKITVAPQSYCYVEELEEK